MVPPRRTIGLRTRSVDNSRSRSTPDRSDSAATMRGARHAELLFDRLREVTNQFADRSRFDIPTYGLRVAAETVVVSYRLHYPKSSDAVLARRRSGDGVYVSRDGVSPKLRPSEPPHGREASPFVLGMDFPRTVIGLKVTTRTVARLRAIDCANGVEPYYRSRPPVAVLSRGALSSRFRTTNTPLLIRRCRHGIFHWNCGQSRESHLTYIQVVDSELFAWRCYRVVCTVHSGSYGRSYT